MTQPKDNTVRMQTQVQGLSFFRDDTRLHEHVQRLREAWGLDDWTDDEILYLKQAIVTTALRHNVDLTAPGGFREACLLLAAERARMRERGGE
ncbi:MAG: hypothetical protein KatS3mg051_1439 [Anaerolineae bacterium]|nr:MAG: hypothetical protein KatS3mg051_1439 [Anaerolineae bacterium]